MISRNVSLPVSLRFAVRELRGGLSGFRIFMACLILGVAAIAAVGSLTSAINEGLAREGQSILGGDIEISRFQKEIPTETLAWLEENGTISKSTRMRTMVRTEANGSVPKSALVEMRSVDELYPLYGDFITTPAIDNHSLLEKRGDVWGIAIDPMLADRLGVVVGDTLLVGALKTEVRALVNSEPDKANLGFQLGPSVFMSLHSLAETGLVTTGTLMRYFYKLKLDDPLSLQAMRDSHKEKWGDTDWRIRDRNRSAPGMQRFIDQMGMFLSLVGLAALVVGGVGVGNAVKGYMDFKTRTIATLKILGADGRTIFATYFFQVLLIGVASIIVGLIIGALLPSLLAQFLPASLPIKPEGGVYPTSLALAAAYGLMITVAFTAWPLGKARDLPAVRLFRALVAPETSRPRGAYIVLIIVAAVITGLLAVGLSGDKMLAGGFLVGALTALGLLRLTSWVIEKLAAAAPRPKNALLRMAIANIHRPGAATGAVVISLGLGLTLFAGLALIEGNLNAQLQEEVPSEAPAFFLLDIQSTQVDTVRDQATDIAGVSDIEFMPNLRGRVISLNDVPAAEADVAPEFGWILRGDRGLAYSNAPPPGSQITEGTWWEEDYTGPPEVSVGVREAAGLGLKIGDQITMNILGRDITATVRSLREINWGSFGFNFVFMFDPNTLSKAPHTYMATLKASGAAESEAYTMIIRDFPNVTAIRMKEVISSVNTMLGQVNKAVQATSMVSIISGILVLAGAIAAGFRQRVYESVILKVVGAVRGQILRAYLVEYLMIGAVTAAIALGLGSLVGWIVVTEVWDMDFKMLPMPMIVTIGSALFITVSLGLLSSARALAVKPNEVLRSE